MKKVEFYRCSVCGNVIVKLVDSGVPVACCGQPMDLLVAGAQDASLEKHVPAVKVDGREVKVTVGSVEHPMTPEHYIQMICLVTEKGFQVAPLSADAAPEASFVVTEGDAPIAVYEYCNLHGLWVAEI